MSLGIEPSCGTSVDEAMKNLRKPEIELFAELDFEISPASSLESSRRVVERTLLENLNLSERDRGWMKSEM